MGRGGRLRLGGGGQGLGLEAGPFCREGNRAGGLLTKGYRRGARNCF